MPGKNVIGSNTNVGIESGFDRNYSSAYLSQDKAAQVTKNAFGNTASIAYDVNGAVVVPGKSVFTAKPTLETGSKYGADVRRFINNIGKNSYPFRISDYKGAPSLSSIIDKQGFYNFLQNLTYIEVPVSQDVQFLNAKAFDANYVFDSSDYTAVMDNRVEDMINAKPDEYNKKYRRIAKLAKALKMAVLAQTNDTNPFYTMHVSELFDRLVDYFARVNNMIAVYYNINYFCGDIGDILMVGDQVAYAQYNRTTYSGKNRIEISKLLSQLQASMVGLYYDPESLDSTLNYAVMGYNPFHKGSAKFICPVISHSLNGSLGSMYIPGAVDNSLQLITILNSMINVIYSSEFSIISAGLAAFNGVPMLGKLPTKCVLQSKQQLVNWIQAHEVTDFNSIQDMSTTSSTGLANLTVYRPKYRGKSTTSSVPACSHGNTLSYVSKFNGVRTTCGLKYSGGTAIVASGYGTWSTSAVKSYVEQSPVGNSDLNNAIIAQYAALSPIKNINDGGSNNKPQICDYTATDETNVTENNPHILYDEYHAFKYLPGGTGTPIALSTAGVLIDADAYCVQTTVGGTPLAGTPILMDNTHSKGSSYLSWTRFTLGMIDDGYTHAGNITASNVLSLVDLEFTPNILDDSIRVYEGNLTLTNTVVLTTAALKHPVINRYCSEILGWNPFITIKNGLTTINSDFVATYIQDDFADYILPDYRDTNDLSRIKLNENKARLLYAYTDFE